MRLAERLAESYMGSDLSDATHHQGVTQAARKCSHCLSHLDYCSDNVPWRVKGASDPTTKIKECLCEVYRRCSKERAYYHPREDTGLDRCYFVAVLVYKAFSLGQPSYLVALFEQFCPGPKDGLQERYPSHSREKKKGSILFRLRVRVSVLCFLKALERFFAFKV